MAQRKDKDVKKIRMQGELIYASTASVNTCWYTRHQVNLIIEAYKRKLNRIPPEHSCKPSQQTLADCTRACSINWYACHAVAVIDALGDLNACGDAYFSSSYYTTALRNYNAAMDICKAIHIRHGLAATSAAQARCKRAALADWCASWTQTMNNGLETCLDDVIDAYNDEIDICDRAFKECRDACCLDQ